MLEEEFGKTVEDFQLHLDQYGRQSYHKNEDARPRLTSVLTLYIKRITVEPVLLHDVRQETFDAVRQAYAVRREILALTAKFATGLLCSFAEYALTWDAKS